MEEISCCGIPCFKCVSYKGDYAKKAKEILEAAEASNLDEWQDKLPKKEEFSYDDFKKGLKWFSEFVVCFGCHAGGGCPDCIIRKCCREKGVDNCSRCKEFPCKIIDEFKEKMGIDVKKNFERL